MERLWQPAVTHLLAEEWYERSSIPKPTALGTPLRYSSAYACGRQMGYAALDAEPSNPMDEAGAWATGLGTLIHEQLQQAILRRYPGAMFEVASMVGGVSGSCDALIDVNDIGTHFGGTHVLYELKTMGTYGFDKQVGWNRMRSQLTGGEGPSKKAIVQAGMNVLGMEKYEDLHRGPLKIETVIMGTVGFEALSKNKSESMGVDGYNRFLAEWAIPRDEWEPLALDELERMASLEEAISGGFIPARIGRDDDGERIELNPRGGKWQCDYCQYRALCNEDGPGMIKAEGSFLTKREEK